ncbi:MAG TPA: hypothetical protein VJ841_04695, partial [Candidatus Saccharimonadales bacterium]|nr:hypothetical protein [Candidatus Saccharimonadales bacterium]
MAVLSITILGDSSVRAATTTLRPNGDVTAGWNTGGANDGTCSGPHCSRIDEASPDTSDYIETATLLGSNMTDVFDIQDGSIGQAATQITIRTYARSGFALPALDAMDTITPSLYINGAYQTGTTITPSYPDWQWYTSTFTGFWSQAAINAMRVRYINTIQGLGLVQNDLQIATNEVAVDYTPDAALTQSTYRLYQSSTTTTPGTALAAQNTAADDPVGSSFRVRLGVSVATNALIANGYQFKLQYAERQGTCDGVFAGESYTDVGSTGAIHWSDTAAIADGATISAATGDPTSGGATTYQTYRESSPFSPVNQVAIGNMGLWDFSLASDPNVTGKSYCFRMVKSDGSLFATYSVLPEITLTGLLTVDVVDAGGTSTSANLVFNPVNTLGLCQSSQANLGSYKIRVNNDISLTGWGASIAPTAGASALWQSGANTYDVNDSNGCTDGVDSDTVGGQMSVSFTGASS